MRNVNMPIHFRKAFEGAGRIPRQEAIAIPAEEAGEGSKEHATRGSRDPDIPKATMFREDLFEQGNVLHRAAPVLVQASEIARRAHPNRSLSIYRQRSDDI